ncbi:MAG TPA: hypothetical protein VLH94_01505 [Spirochaetia bacterium]|nr:hypothetical protein [Spirochaetia bacterium]
MSTNQNSVEVQERDKFLESNGWHSKQKTQNRTELCFMSGLGKPDRFFIFIVNFQVLAIRESNCLMTKINDLYTAFTTDNFCVIKEGEFITLYGK